MWPWNLREFPDQQEMLGAEFFKRSCLFAAFGDQNDSSVPWTSLAMASSTKRRPSATNCSKAKRYLRFSKARMRLIDWFLSDSITFIGFPFSLTFIIVLFSIHISMQRIGTIFVLITRGWGLTLTLQTRNKLSERKDFFEQIPHVTDFSRAPPQLAKRLWRTCRQKMRRRGGVGQSLKPVISESPTVKKRG